MLSKFFFELSSKYLFLAARVRKQEHEKNIYLKDLALLNLQTKFYKNICLVNKRE